MDSSSAAFLSGERPSAGTVTVKKPFLALIGVALLATGAFTSWQLQGLSAVRANMAASEAAPPLGALKGAGRPAAALLTSIGVNATVLEPTKLYYTNCIVCFTCGESWTHHVAEVNRGDYLEFGAGCADPYRFNPSDNAYICCA
mmetsp:Transcript_62886/g.146425  ORF Transcript_62886/g.146425 Transcript_62886/m.146425 type:complete len:144 (-) Transcript_62886:105-536(-)